MQKISGYFETESNLLKAVKKLKEDNIQIDDVFSPYPIHGLDQVLELRRSWLPRAAFIGGFVGAACGFLFQTWVFTKAYSINIGGKPFFSFFSFVPVMFECAVLFAAVSIVFAYLLKSNLGAGADNKIYNNRATDDRFVVVLFVDDQIEEIKQKFKKLGAQGVELCE